MVDFKRFYKDKANVAYMVLGYPNLEISKQFLQNLDEMEIDILELGVAYSDPIADGKIITEAANQALSHGADINAVFSLLKEIQTKKALVFMVYYNLIFSYGLKTFVEKAKEFGICALIVPELSFEESNSLREICDQNEIALITLISLTTPKERVKKLAKSARGFIYMLASVGITGGKSAAEELLKEKIEQIRKYSNLPIFIGFGVKNNKDVKKMRQIADGVIVGTSVVELFASNDLAKIQLGVSEIFKK